MKSQKDFSDVETHNGDAGLTLEFSMNIHRQSKL